MEWMLIKEILELSENKIWNEAKKEWRLKDINKSKEPSTCLCGHYPILELCLMQNNKNNKETIVGNCCVNKFLDESKQNKMFTAIAKGKVNKSLILLSYEKGIINDSERDFLLNVWRKRILSEKQQSWFNKLNIKIIEVYKSGKLG